MNTKPSLALFWAHTQPGDRAIEKLPREAGVMAAFCLLVRSSELIAVISGCFDAWHTGADWE